MSPLSILEGYERACGDRAAVVTLSASDRSVSVRTWAQLASDVRRLTRYLVAECAPSGAIGVWCAKSGPSVAAMIAATCAGRPFAVMNRRLPPASIRAQLRQCGSGDLFVDARGAAQLQRDGAIEGVKLHVLPASFGEPRDPAEDAIGRDETVGSALRSATPSATDLGACLFTSGSTGHPKAVGVGRLDLFDRARSEAEFYGLTPDDVLLNVLPFSFDVGLNQLFSSLLAGARLVMLDSWLVGDVVEAVAAHGVTGISAVPWLWQQFVRSKTEIQGAGSTLRYLTVSGGGMATNELEALRALAPSVDILKTYGQTETFRSAALAPRFYASKMGSVGRPYPGANVYVVDPQGEPVPPGTTGEIVHTGLGTMTGYLGDALPAENLRPNPFAGPGDLHAHAVFTHDYGYLDEDGFLYVVGRRDAMVKVNGNRVYPAEAARALIGLDGVLDAEVVAIERDGETNLVALVVLADPSDRALSDLKRALRSRLASYLLPKWYVSLPSLPRTENGKPDGPAARAIAEDAVPRGAT